MTIFYCKDQEYSKRRQFQIQKVVGILSSWGYLCHVATGTTQDADWLSASLLTSLLGFMAMSDRQYIGVRVNAICMYMHPCHAAHLDRTACISFLY